METAYGSYPIEERKIVICYVFLFQTFLVLFRLNTTSSHVTLIFTPTNVQPSTFSCVSYFSISFMFVFLCPYAFSISLNVFYALSRITVSFTVFAYFLINFSLSLPLSIFLSFCLSFFLSYISNLFFQFSSIKQPQNEWHQIFSCRISCSLISLQSVKHELLDYPNT